MIKVANAPCSWGVLEFTIEGKKDGYAQVLDEIAETGYEGTELGDWGFLPTRASHLRHEIHARGLCLVGAFLPVMLKNLCARESGIKNAVRMARLLAEVEGPTPFIVLSDDNGKDLIRIQNTGRIRPEQGLTPFEWQIAVETVETIAASVRQKTGLRTVFHPHCGGFVETPAEVDMLLQLTDPELVGLCLDTGHYRFGGGNPLECLQQNFERIWHVHFKDFQPDVARRSRLEGWDYFTSVKKGIFCELGQGEVDFPSILRELKNRHYGSTNSNDGWIVVEQDVLPGMGSPKESAQRNRCYLDKIGLHIDTTHLMTRSLV